MIPKRRQLKKFFKQELDKIKSISPIARKRIIQLFNMRKKDINNFKEEGRWKLQAK